MQDGRLGVAMTIPNQWVEVYQVPTMGVRYATVNISALNMSDGPAKMDLAITIGTTPSMEEFVLFKNSLPESGAINDLTCRTLSPGERVLVRADNENVSVRVEGLIKPGN